MRANLRIENKDEQGRTINFKKGPKAIHYISIALYIQSKTSVNMVDLNLNEFYFIATACHNNSVFSNKTIT